MLTPETSNTYNMRLHLLTLPRSCVTQSCSCNIFWYCSGILLLSVCLRLSDDKFRKNNAIICPESYSHISTNHNDGVGDFLIRQIMENFKNTVRLMLCIHVCCGFDRPNRVLRQGVRVLIVVQKQHFTSANTM